MANVDITDSKVASHKSKKSRTQALTDSLLRDRAERAAHKAIRSSTKIERGDFDPFSVTRWRVIAGDDPGHLVKTPKRMGKVGWLIQCRACAVELDSKGWAYCPACMGLPAEERRDHEPVKRVGRPCARPGCGERLSKRARTDARYCSAACRKAVSRDKSGSGLPLCTRTRNVTARAPRNPTKSGVGFGPDRTGRFPHQRHRWLQIPDGTSMPRSRAMKE